MKKEKYINIEDAIAIKGIALILVIWGHNHYLTPLDSKFLYWLYDFHVVAFFILPCFYKSKKEKFVPFLNKLTIRCIIPFTFFYLISFCIALLFNKINDVDMELLIKGYFHLGGVTAEKAVGFQFVWFLPAFYIFSLIRYLGNNNKYIHYIILLIGLYIVAVGDDKRAILHRESPLYISQAIYFYTLGTWVYYFNRLIPYFKYFACLLFLIFSYTFIYNRYIYDDVLVTMTGFMVIWVVAHFLCKVDFIQKIGNKSLIIYLVHIYIYCILDLFIPNKLVPQIIVFILTLSIACIISEIFDKYRIFRVILFPRNIDEIKTIFYKSNSNK